MIFFFTSEYRSVSMKCRYRSFDQCSFAQSKKLIRMPLFLEN